MKKTFFRILGFVLLIDLFYMYVGQTVTQSEQHPPEALEITPDTDPVALSALGEELVENKGGCLICHKIEESGNERGPDLRGVGGRAATRQAGVDAEAYLTESLRRPGAYVVEGYPPIMPAADLPPADLTATELKAVVAFLQSMGGEVTVQVTEEDVVAAAAQAKDTGGTSPEIAFLSEKGCVTCHDLEGDRRSVGPPLTTTAMRLTEGQIRESILEPDVLIAEGFAAGLMPKEEFPPAEVDQMVEYIVRLAGPAAGTTLWEKIRRLLSHPMIQLVSLIFVFNAGAWWAIEWLGAR